MEHRTEINSTSDNTSFHLQSHRLDSTLAQVRTAISEAGIPDAGFEARSLVRTALRISKEVLLTDQDRLVTDEEQTLLESLIGRRLRRVPLQYVIGTVEFYGRRFRVDARVLIPRPETELLIDQALAFAMERRISKPRILDIGTGSGAIAVTLAAELPESRIVATDISGDALEVARENARSTAVQDRIEFVRCSLVANVTGTFEIVVCNPPYVLSAFLSGADVQPELAYEPLEALDGGKDGMKVYRPLFSSLERVLAPGGAAFIEIDPQVVSLCVAEAKRNLPAASISVLTDLAGLERCLVIELPR